MLIPIQKRGVSNNLQVIHSLFDTPPFEVYEKKYYGHNITRLELEMRLGDTLMFSLCGEC